MKSRDAWLAKFVANMDYASRCDRLTEQCRRIAAEKEGAEYERDEAFRENVRLRAALLQLVELYEKNQRPSVAHEMAARAQAALGEPR